MDLSPTEGNRLSSSSEEAAIDTSDKAMDITEQINNGLNVIAEKQINYNQRRDRFYANEPMPGSSRDQTASGRGRQQLPPPLPQFLGERRREKSSETVAKEKAEQIVRQAETSKAQILEVSGKDVLNNYDDVVINDQLYHHEKFESNRTQNNQEAHLPSVADEDYLIVGNYVDQQTRERILNDEFVDFMRLLPRDKLQIEEDNRMEIVNQDGRTYFVPASTLNDSGSISNFSRWE